ncbi:SH3 domain-containing protein [Acetatifactor aquisgranensis]|uniref:SH3 domain-containing protein n=1 Tax=Acetatifactor aquisgranensis TaxID=2941233 RepID=UPI002041C324|nr:SH3 domain-containing protein [Acetatifactor aquisgranensis]
MSNDNKMSIRDSIVKYSKFLFPAIVILVAACTVSYALGANSRKTEQPEESAPPAEETVAPVSLEGEGSDEQPEEDAPKETPLILSEDAGIQALIASYYDTMASGDSAAMTALYDELTENEQLRCEEMAKYVDHISNVEVYTKDGPETGAILVYAYYRISFLNHEEEVPGWQMFYVRDDGQGAYHIKNEKNFTEEEKQYISDMSGQDDVIEFHNRVTVEYNALMEANPQMLTYLGELGTQVNAAVGVRLAEQNAVPAEGDGQAEGTEAPAGTETPDAAAPAESTPQSALATTTVNVRSSDSEQADRLGQVEGGTRVQVQEVRANGWTKIVYDGADGYIKTEFLQMEESAEGQEVVGTVTANTNVNVRAAASETAEQLGILVGGDTAELLGTEGDWCKIKFDGKAGYVKAEFVTQ